MSMGSNMFSGDSVTQTQEQPIDEDAYNFYHKHRGYAVIIVNEDFKLTVKRGGADEDLMKMRFVAKRLGFCVFNDGKERNLSKMETLQLLNRVRQVDHSDSDCFTLMVSTHGLEQRNARAKGRLDHALVCSDEEMIFTRDIIDMFNDRNCPSLASKPKLFFIQACRGSSVDDGGYVKVDHSSQAVYSGYRHKPGPAVCRIYQTRTDVNESLTDGSAPFKDDECPDNLTEPERKQTRDNISSNQSKNSDTLLIENVKSEQCNINQDSVDVNEFHTDTTNTSANDKHCKQHLKAGDLNEDLVSKSNTDDVVHRHSTNDTAFHASRCRLSTVSQKEIHKSDLSKTSGTYESQSHCDCTNETSMDRTQPVSCPDAIRFASSRAISEIYAPNTPVLKCDADMLVMYAIPEGQMAWRNPAEGSWMIHDLYKVISSYDLQSPRSFLSLLTKVAARMSINRESSTSGKETDRKKAIPVIEHKLVKDIMFGKK